MKNCEGGCETIYRTFGNTDLERDVAHGHAVLLLETGQVQCCQRVEEQEQADGQDAQRAR